MFLTTPIVIKSGEAPNGVLQITNRKDGLPFDGDDEMISKALAEMAGRGLRNAKTFEAVETENARLRRELTLHKMISS